MQVSSISINPPDFSDSDDIFSKIVRSRKRKLLELFVVASHPDGLPNHTITDIDAIPPNTAEKQFLDGSDIVQYVQIDLVSTPGSTLTAFGTLLSLYLIMFD